MSGDLLCGSLELREIVCDCGATPNSISEHKTISSSWSHRSKQIIAPWAWTERVLALDQDASIGKALTAKSPAEANS